MTALEQLEALNPVPDQRGNPGQRTTTRHSWRRVRIGVAVMVAAAAMVVGAIVVGNQGQPPVELDVAGQPDDEPSTTAAQIAPDGSLTATDEDTAGAVVRLIIPGINVDVIVVEGVSVNDLRNGPGHYPLTPFPGQPGNAAIAGHRTTYGAPFFRLDEIEVGDSIYVTTIQGTFEYLVDEQLIVEPNDVTVIDDVGDSVLDDVDGNRLTLTTPNPKYSAAERLVIVALLVGDPVPRLDFSRLGQAEDAWPTEIEIPDISDATFRDGSQPYLAFAGDDSDALTTARAFLGSQFGDWADGVDLAVSAQTDRAAAVRWISAEHNTGGWIVLIVGDGHTTVWEMTMDGVDATMYNDQTGGRGFGRATRPLTLDVLRPVPFAMDPEHPIYDDGPVTSALVDDPLTVVRVGQDDAKVLTTFEIERGDRFQEVRTIVRNEAGDQIGAIAMSLALPTVNEIGVVTAVEDSQDVRNLIESNSEAIAGPLEMDRWQSVGFLQRLAPDFAPDDVADIPTHEVTLFALRPISTVQQLESQHDLLVGLSRLGDVVYVPRPGVDAVLDDTPVPAPASGYTIDELPSVDLCRHIQAMGWARPEVFVNDDRQVFDTAEQARDSAPETAVGHTVEFRNTSDVVTGFARPTDYSPWAFSSLAIVEQVDDGWALAGWERATC